MTTGCFVVDEPFAGQVYPDHIREQISDLMPMSSDPLPTAEAFAPGVVHRDVEVILSTWGLPRLGPERLDQFPSLRLICHGAGSIAPFVTPDIWERGIRITTATDANAVPVAEFTFATIIYALKRVLRHRETYRLARKRVRVDMPGAYQSTVGLVSLGSIGRLVLDRLKSLDVRVLVHDPFVQQEVMADLGVESVDLPTLFARSNVVSLHTPLTDETRGMFGADLLGRLPANASLINTARGGLIDEPALMRLAQERQDLDFYLDVTDPEPPDESSTLYTLENVFLTPHIAGSMDGECARMGQMILDEITGYVRDGSLEHEVFPQQLPISAHAGVSR
ncbi:hydroxyacid dehydrogenase [Mucisphaera calidilacus]|uniref:(S)-sulfolactate dehydrogenase n=1 Tax=Mucisphaera calidilacus TaxID=2527982 RepID=A0A518BWZ7_9BACT|nr:hydroxyacid dehydrogenase [Mucisphaera calidilacus]QDU71464.1 (S)-sulfolactate dehydrogenase [Mucisphaera calidilacus]